MSRIIIIVLLFTLPVATWFIYKPVRILAPELNGMHCISDSICLEDSDRSSDASLLYFKALTFVNSQIDEIKHRPRIIFCSTQECNQSFGFHAPAKAHTIGTSGIVIAPQGWNEHILRHELIHHLQAERLGVIGQWRSPKWFKEGMAYSLSENPRPTLTENLLKYKADFETWSQNVDKEDFWQQAKNL